MEKDNKETIFEVIAVVMSIAGLYTSNRYVIVVGLIGLCVSIWFWYNNNLTNPIEEIRNETKELRKDLNSRKELEEIKMTIELMKLQLGNKKASINPFLLIIILLLIAMLIMYLKDKGII